MIKTIDGFCMYINFPATLGRNLFTNIPKLRGTITKANVCAMLANGSCIVDSPIIYCPMVYIHRGTKATT